ncbi:MAG: aminoacyl-tRNA hydrolase [Geminicoccaceae bacterium]|nr:aminoacyl-tRNA hydrolase [Geminicoccaceae bacterium]MCX7631340.1 aminoacyl-tRNA hydrolase [Geminicoccaceae bacterium]MDW8369982.1 aminoacyl-tRNA hydrolase [Geminicoccaceae bacterium]
MKLFVGLGNPGPEYEDNRHNVGFMAVERIAARWRFPAWRGKWQGRVTEGPLDGERALLLEPLTFMNESGRSVAAAVRFLKLPYPDVVVFHDELDLAPGKIRVKLGGGVAGHNGLRSIAACLGTQEFRRVRIGIGHPGHKEKVTGHVLSDFAKSERPWLERLLDAIAEAAPLLAKGDDSGFMNKVALLSRDEEEEARRRKPAAERPEAARQGKG